MLQICSLNKKIKKKQILRDVNLDLTEGIYGLLGPNGAGKTTLLRCIMGLYTYDGKIVAGGKNKANIGYLPQKFALFKEWTVRDALSYMAVLKRMDKEEIPGAIEEALDFVNLSDFIDKKTGSLSGGMIRRVGIAQSILNNPEILIVDEPTAGLDPEERMRFKVLISQLKKGRTIVISTHITDDVDALCDRVLIINQGRIVGDYTLSEIKTKARDKVYEIPQQEVVSHGEIIKTYEKENRSYSRVLSSQIMNYPKLEPTIEDGYLCEIKQI